MEEGGLPGCGTRDALRIKEEKDDDEKKDEEEKGEEKKDEEEKDEEKKDEEKEENLKPGDKIRRSYGAGWMRTPRVTSAAMLLISLQVRSRMGWEVLDYIPASQCQAISSLFRNGGVGEMWPRNCMSYDCVFQNGINIW
jgi:hypothetical protein